MPSTIANALFSLGLLGPLAIVQAGPVSVPAAEVSKRDIRSPLPARADPLESRFQPVMDFDTDGCYNTAAIDPSGSTNPGLDATLKGTAEGCRDLARLQNNNVYSRKRCNNGWCAIMYEYYFEKDQAIWGSFLGGHRHDWENVVVFVRNDKVEYVSPACHGKYEHGSSSPRLLDLRPKMVYHKDGASTHCIRHANAADDAIENHTGRWFTGALVGWDFWPSVSLRNTMLQAWSGGVGPKLDDEFASSLAAAAGSNVPGFDPNIDS